MILTPQRECRRLQVSDARLTKDSGILPHRETFGTKLEGVVKRCYILSGLIVTPTETFRFKRNTLSKSKNSKERTRYSLNHVYRGRPKRFMYYKGIHTIITARVFAQKATRIVIIYFPVIFSSFKSLTTIYRLSPIQPQRNHLI